MGALVAICALALSGLAASSFAASGRAPAREATAGAAASRPGAVPQPGTKPPPGGPIRWPKPPHVALLPRPAWVAVPVATVWTRPGTDRPEDAPAVSGRPDVPAWLTSLTIPQKLGLDDLLSTQALLYEQVLVLGSRRGWDRVLVNGQTGSVYPLGIEGWIPATQLTFTAPPPAPLHVTVAVPSVRFGSVEVSYGTELPAEEAPGGRVAVHLPQGRFVVPAADVREHSLKPSGPAVVAEARRFLGL
ncbi:MAG TPA: hypothetical protein VKI19_10135, partial [Acidimicrobiales bacterium]|nr:hypothetical protein [Acidimicrobiales bacterium]